MGTISQETIDKIRSKDSPAKQKVKKNEKLNNNNNKNNNINDVLSNIYFPLHEKEFKNNNNEKELNENNIIIENKIINEEKKNEMEEKEIDNLIFRKNQSMDLSNDLYKRILLDNNDQKYNEEIYSNKDNESNNSDYIDVSEKFVALYKIKKDNKLLKAKKIRDSYYNKLIIKGQWNPLKKEKIFNNIFFFDWDDTLLCTSYLIQIGALNDMQINQKDKEIMSNLDNLAFTLLSKTVNLGNVIIVTNGAPGWIEISSVTFYPKTTKVLDKIKIISARGLCEKQLPGDMRQWKTKAFKHAIDSIKIEKDIPTNIICFGDSIIEMEASYNIKEYFNNAYLKTIKFKESPTPTELEKELKIITTQLDSIITNFKNLSIKVTRKKNE
jgi:hypothetical protein